MAKKLYLYTVLGALCQIEFPEYAEQPKPKKGETPPEPVLFDRAGEDRGALYLRPGSTVELTEDEYNYILAKRPEVARTLEYQGYEFKKKPEEPKPLLPPGGDQPSSSNAPSEEPAKKGSKSSSSGS